jgi:hypothetical protein
MPLRPRAPAAVPAALLLALAAVSPPGALAQTRGPAPLSKTQFGLGYVANAPEVMAGGSVYVLLPMGGGIGVYVDAKFDVSNPSDEKGWDPNATSAQVRKSPDAKFLQTEESWRSFNVALVRPLTPSLLAYIGGGLAKVRTYDLYAAPADFPLGVGGVVWALDPPSAATRANFLVGMLMRMTPRVTAQFGYETRPSGVTVGLSLRLPPW